MRLAKSRLAQIDVISCAPKKGEYFKFEILQILAAAYVLDSVVCEGTLIKQRQSAGFPLERDCGENTGVQLSLGQHTAVGDGFVHGHGKLAPLLLIGQCPLSHRATHKSPKGLLGCCYICHEF